MQTLCNNVSSNNIFGVIYIYSCDGGARKLHYCGGSGVVSIFSTRGPYLYEVESVFNPQTLLYIKQLIDIEFIIVLASKGNAESGELNYCLSW